MGWKRLDEEEIRTGMEVTIIPGNLCRFRLRTPAFALGQCGRVLKKNKKTVTVDLLDGLKPVRVDYGDVGTEEKENMTITDARKRIKEAIAELNEMQDSLEFEVEETDYFIGFKNHGKVNKSRSYGAYEHYSVFEEFKRKADAYVNAMSFAELLVKAASLKDPKAYHNFCERR